MIVICDVDGCLTEGRNHPIDLGLATELGAFIKEHNIQFILASGRSQAYMECMAQVLDLNTPYICENGAAIYDPNVGKYVYEIQKSGIEKAKKVLDCVFNEQILYEPNKEFGVSFRLEKCASIHDELRKVKTAVGIDNDIQITNSNSAIDITPSGCTKGRAMQWLLNEYLACDDKLVVGFGDAENDLDFLARCQFSGAPNNSTDAVKTSVDYVASKRAIGGLLEFLKSRLQA